jgi:hypothetical protein
MKEIVTPEPEPYHTRIGFWRFYKNIKKKPNQQQQ